MMMKKVKICGLLILLCGSLSLVPAPEVSAAEGKSSTAVMYGVPEGTPFPFILEVRGNGTVYDGTESIRNGSVQYEMVEGEQKQLRVVPDAGYLITHIYSQTTSQKDIIGELSGEELTVTVPNGRMILTFVFEPVPTEDAGDTGNTGGGGTGGEPGKDPAVKLTAMGAKAGRTGDEAWFWGYLVIAGISGMVLLVMSRRKRQLP